MKKFLVAGVGVVSSIAAGYVVYEKYFHVDDVSHDVLSSIPTIAAKDNCKLKLVQIVFRHGARTPIQTPEYLPKVKYGDHLMKHGEHTFIPYVTKSSEGKSIDISSSLYRHGTVTIDEFSHGQLTAKGANQMHELGNYLRNHYISKLRFLPKDYYSDVVYVRSTAVQRTVESVRCTLAGKPGCRLYFLANRLVSIQLCSHLEGRTGLLFTLPTKTVENLKPFLSYRRFLIFEILLLLNNFVSDFPYSNF